jgi:hypothetical protein
LIDLLVNGDCAESRLQELGAEEAAQQKRILHHKRAQQQVYGQGRQAVLLQEGEQEAEADDHLQMTRSWVNNYYLFIYYIILL